MKILVTGAAGSIGSEIVRQLHKDHIVYAIDINEIGLLNLMEELGVVGRVADIRDDRTMRDVFSDFKPDVVYHAAAYKSVNMMEVVPLEAINTNVIGTYNVLYYSKIYEVKKFVYISTDKVVNAHSVMGQSKGLAETMVRNSGKGFVAVRFGNVLDSRGSLLPIWRRQHEAGEPLTITDERMERYFMSIPEAVELVLKAAEQDEGLVIMDMGQPKKIIDLKTELYGDYPTKIIGVRPGETLDEKLMTVEEQGKAIKQDKFYIIK